MKTRSDFVSNSSSSSFILKDAGFFRYFGIMKQDINDALVDLCGGKKFMADMLDKEIDRCINALAKCDGDMSGYYVERLAQLRSEGLRQWVIYDMTDEGDRKKCHEEWDDHFSNWFAPSEGDYENWEKLIGILQDKCGFDNIFSVINGKDKAIAETKLDRKTGKWKDVPFPGGAAFIKKAKRQLRIKTMKELLYDNGCTLVIHFGDNEVHNVKGMSEEGDEDVAGSAGKKRKKKKFKSEMYSARRFFEILIDYFVKKGRIDLSDPEFLEYWLVPEDHWWKTDKNSKYKNRKYLTIDGKTATWEDVYDDMLGCNAVMHEG